MKTNKMIRMVLLFGIVTQMAFAQNCPGTKVLMSKGASGCGCQCHKKCVDASEVQTYLNNGWSYGDCYFRCCFGNWVRLGEEKNISETSLTDVYPNPASMQTTIFFSLSESQKVSFKLFDMTGRLVATFGEEMYDEGEHEFIWDAGKENPGVYFLQMQAGGYGETKRVTII